MSIKNRIKTVAMNIDALIFIHFLDFFLFFPFSSHFSRAQKAILTNKKFSCQLNNKTVRIDEKVNKVGTKSHI